MFYSQLILAKKGPLGQVWLAAHWDKKLTKAAISAADVGEAADSIANPVVPLALRVSGHLLLGVTRIYSRKVGYLFNDCSEALVKIKMAFRPGVVDLPETASTANLSSINVASFGEFDAQIPYDIQALVAPSLSEWMTTPSQTQARRADITLAESSSASLYNDDSFTVRDSFGNNDSFGGGDWQPFDADDQAQNDLDTSGISDVERGRNAADVSGLSIRPDLDTSIDNLRDDGVDLFQDDKDDVEMGNPEAPDVAADDVSMPDIDMQPVDDNFGINVEPPSPMHSQSIDFHADTSFVPTEMPKRLRKRKIGQDSMTELSSAVIKKGLKDASDIVRVRGGKGEKRAKVVKQPVDELMHPSTKGLNASLLGMFKLTMKHAKLPTHEAPGPVEEEAVERTRRQAAAPSYHEVDEDDEFQAPAAEKEAAPEFEFGAPDPEDDHGLDLAVERSLDDEELRGADGLAMDLDLSLAPAATAEATADMPPPTLASTATHKWHPHTVKVMKVLRQTMEHQESVSYKQLTKTTRSRRTAAALFFELLQLKTLDLVEVDQPTAFGNIQVTKTDRFADYIPAVDGADGVNV
ncbi:double-strand-break repair protein rad21 [Achlya hypogyna]|uniref:Double-strand-break repair protein rad21 n=1 Tax=Achlya hypogyna TaxID=1202772 RepID=A0A1V9Z1Y3_ACHHY|nr:double-strand-break repair protein rad21 [Achlya hypogyna]